MTLYDSAVIVIMLIVLMMVAYLWLDDRTRTTNRSKYNTADSSTMHRQVADALRQANADTQPRTWAAMEVALGGVRAQAIATARHDICQPLGVPLTPNPHAAHTVQHKVWEATYHHSMRIAIELERSKL